MIFPFLAPSEPLDLEYHSSVFQKRGGLVVWAGGAWRPVSFTQVLGIDCDKIVTREVWVAGEDDLGYDYPIGEAHYTTDTYAMFDRKGESVEVLPEWFGSGFIKKYIKDDALVNFDNGSLGVRNRHRLRLGLAYVRAKETLPPIE